MSNDLSEKHTMIMSASNSHDNGQEQGQNCCSKFGDQIIMTNLDILDDQSLIEIRASKTLADELKLMQVKLVVPQ